MEYSELIPWGMIALLAVGGHIYELFYGGGDTNGRHNNNVFTPDSEGEENNQSLESKTKQSKSL